MFYSWFISPWKIKIYVNLFLVFFDRWTSADAEKVFGFFKMRALAAIAFDVPISFVMSAGILHLGDYRVSAVGVLRFGCQIGVDYVGLTAQTVDLLVEAVSQLKFSSFYINDLIKVALFIRLSSGWGQSF